ncbi:hypothetical protein TIFTF001_026989 [Ficus carica]|uniref:inositol-1,3,4-trisphosphate 5/6-kinase n=1 Tax=Ficus carica TaxID=3494 RepID=A0AA88DM55_FICCA|nr:hypothetical protein TIFTF001_026989 [Ficus carica]
MVTIGTVGWRSSRPRILMSSSSVTLRRLSGSTTGFNSMLQVVIELKIEDRSETLGIPKEIDIYNKETLFDQPARKGLKFPVIAKLLVADVWAKSHKMALVFNHDALKKAEVNRRRRSGDKFTGAILPLMKLLSASFDASTHVNAAVELLKV